MQEPFQHFLEPVVERIRYSAGAAENLKQLHPSQVDLIHEHNWFNLFVKKEYGGLELSLPEALQLEEKLAWADGSFGWTATLCAGANWFIGFLDPALAALLFKEPQVCFAGSGKASGTAKITAEGYQITGAWNYATGAAHATAFTANCLVEKDGQPLLLNDGSQEVRSFIFLKEEVVVTDNWFTLGMIATGSFRFEVNDLSIPANRAFLIHPASIFLNDPIYQYPFLQFAETTLAVNFSGMAIRFLELAPKQLAVDSLQKLHFQRNLFYTSLEESWQRNLMGLPIGSQLLQEVSEQSKKLAFLSRHFVNKVYPYCGMEAANPATEINRIWRNIHTASLHRLLNNATENYHHAPENKI